VSRIFCAVLALLAAVLTAGAAPDPAPDAGPAPPDLADLIREAQSNSPAIQAAEARLEAARRVSSQLEPLPDPLVSIAYTNDGVSRITLGDSVMSRLELSWQQEVPYPGKRGQRAEAASREAERIARGVARLRLETTAAVKSSWADLYRLDRTGATLDETHILLDSFARVTARRYEVGQGIQENVLKAQTEILRIDAELARVRQDRRMAEVRLNAAVGRAADVPIGPVRSLPQAALPADGAALVEEAMTGSPAVAGGEEAVRREEAAVRVARLDLRPDFVWSASYMNRDGLEPMVAGMFGLRLPMFRARRQAQALLQSESELSAARQDLTDLQVRTRSSVRELLARARRADRLVTLYGEGVIPAAGSTLESAQASYGVGRIGFLDLLDDLMVLLQARIDLAVQEADRLQALAALEPLLGRELVVVTATGDRQEGSDEQTP
jgi:outer membrane protein, heavy metal efflux system